MVWEEGEEKREAMVMMIHVCRRRRPQGSYPPGQTRPPPRPRRDAGSARRRERATAAAAPRGCSSGGHAFVLLQTTFLFTTGATVIRFELLRTAARRKPTSGLSLSVALRLGTSSTPLRVACCLLVTVLPEHNSLSAQKRCKSRGPAQALTLPHPAPEIMLM